MRTHVLLAVVALGQQAQLAGAVTPRGCAGGKVNAEGTHCLVTHENRRNHPVPCRGTGAAEGAACLWRKTEAAAACTDEAVQQLREQIKAEQDERTRQHARQRYHEGGGRERQWMEYHAGDGKEKKRTWYDQGGGREKMHGWLEEGGGREKKARVYREQKEAREGAEMQAGAADSTAAAGEGEGEDEVRFEDFLQDV